MGERLPAAGRGRATMAAERILVLLNPGRQSRHYLLGLAAAASRTGRLGLRLELGPIWQAPAGENPAGVVAGVGGRSLNW